MAGGWGGGEKGTKASEDYRANQPLCASSKVTGIHKIMTQIYYVREARSTGVTTCKQNGLFVAVCVSELRSCVKVEVDVLGSRP